jgi:hypothetical protein
MSTDSNATANATDNATATNGSNDNSTAASADSDETKRKSLSGGALAATVICVLLALIGVAAVLYTRSHKRNIIPPTAVVNARGPLPAVHHNQAFDIGAGAGGNGVHLNVYGGGGEGDGGGGGGNADVYCGVVYNAGGEGGVDLDSNNALLYAIPMEAEDGTIDTGAAGNVFVAALSTARCAFSDRNLHSRMPLIPMLARLKILHECDQ